VSPFQGVANMTTNDGDDDKSLKIKMKKTRKKTKARTQNLKKTWTANIRHIWKRRKQWHKTELYGNVL